MKVPTGRDGDQNSSEGSRRLRKRRRNRKALPLADKKTISLAGVQHASGQSRSRSSRVRREDDFYGWLLQEGSALRNRGAEMLDWSNLAEELEAMARSEENSLESYLVVLLKHLLKYRYQAAKITGSWEASIENSRDRISRLLRRSPSLESKIDEIFVDAYRIARRKAGAQMGLRKGDWERLLPATCEWSLDTARDVTFWPQPS